jgi:chromosome partitioning protein
VATGLTKSVVDGMPEAIEAEGQIAADAALLSAELQRLRSRLFPPASEKRLRRFTSGEAARLIGVSDSYLRQLSLDGEGPQPETGPGGRRLYTLDEINALRAHLTAASGTRGKRYLPHRQAGEHVQVIAVTNFKGGSGKTTTAAHLAQGLALKGYRVLAVDLDPQASLSALFGIMPEFDVAENETLYGAIRYDARRRPTAEVVRPTYFAGLDLIPANLELHEFEHTTPKMLAERKTGQQSAGQQDGPLFFARVREALAEVAGGYDVIVLDCPPQLGFLTLGALCAASGLIVTVHPQMLDVASMSQFLFMTSDLLSVVRQSGGRLAYDFQSYLITRHEPNDGPQAQIVGFLRNLFGPRVMTSAMLKSTAVADAGLTKQTLYEVSREAFTRSTYDRAMESLDAVNTEVEALMLKAWGRMA